MNIKQHNPMHPGEFIKKVYLEPFNINNAELALKLGVNTSTISRMLRGQTDVVPLMALKLSRVLGRTAQSWLLMQDNYNLHKAEQTVDLSSYKQIKFATPRN